MPSRGVLAFTALAFLVGAVLGASLLFEGSPTSLLPTFAPDIPVHVRVTNIGTHDADVTVDVTQVGGNARGSTAAFALPSGGTHTSSYAQGSGRFVAELTAQWTGSATSSGRGTARVPGTTEGCGPYQTLVFDVDINTTRGVSFTRLDAACS